ncbi:unnamed protein product [Hyaloperonospora brassicae]|uniref:N-acetyltransferase domain-containing protein n=1 Tax=Hyaloperonospora brassicae TaxID=162125 RepID=A0AAV0TVG4_HYABA|nr:unnamed protein product [Hyaloperonospora brassicae]
MAATAMSSSPALVPSAPLPESSSDIVVRPFRPNDMAQVIELFKEGMPVKGSDPVMDEYIVTSLETDLSDIDGTYIKPGGNFWIATPRDDPTLVVGTVGLEAKSKHEGRVRRLSVKSTHHRRGIGRLLISTLEHWAVGHQIDQLWLTTGDFMDKARGFYRSAGYTETDVIIVRDEPRLARIKIEKRLHVSSHGRTCPRTA